MKSLVKNLSLLSMGLMIYGCNEKISPELQNGNSTTIPTAITPDEYYFKITNNSAAVLNYKLHRTGAGNAAAQCKVSSTGLALSNTLYVGEAASAHDLKNYDISCFLEAEELSMFFNGLSFKMEASKNTCDYVGYSPYSYFDSLPGASTATWSGITCGENVQSADAQSVVAEPSGVDVLGGPTRSIGCEEMVDTSIPAAANRLIKTIPENFQQQCAFDYATNGGGNGRNCDTGTMSISLIEVTEIPEQAGPPVVPKSFQPTPVSTPNYSCGGSIGACVEGPIRQLSEFDGLPRGTQIFATELNTDFTTTYTLPKLIGVKGSMHDIVNYRKGLASLDLNFMDYTTGSDANWSDTNYNKAFDPFLMEKYAANQYPDNTTIIDSAAILTQSRITGVTQVPHAADPFLGTSQRVNPFYTFYCLDRAFEIKSRIRMVVRDWDKVFPSTSSNLELISDSYMPLGSRRQDLPDSEESIPNDPGNFNALNDINDWDVLVEMTRSDPNLVGIYDAGFTEWSPTSGWWAPGIFPNEVETE